ncbi:MAG: penicillin-binding protein 2 [Patescibacteria group bacterium]|nr:penicillin-binding protein 2 [Patescibacteria group bacterium]
MSFHNPFEIKTSFQPTKSARSLDWEESASDLHSDVEGIYDEDRQPPRSVWLKFGLFLVFGILAGRIFYLQIIQGANFRVLSDNNRIRSQTLLAPRGLIVDRNGEILAQNAVSFNLVAVPFDLPRNKSLLQEELDKAATVFGFNAQQARQKLSTLPGNSINPVVLMQDIGQDEAILLQTRASEFPGFLVQKIPVRDYINAPQFAHVIGYSGLINEEEFNKANKQLYDPVDFIGKTGIEAAYEKYLHGINGQDMVEVDAIGKLLNVLGQNKPVPGETLQLNIDKGLQENLYEGLFRAGKDRGAAVAINPKNGQVLALVSTPGFNNSLFVRGIKTEDYNKLLNDKNLPLFNRAVSGTYPPGSTVKPMVAIAGLQEGVIDQNTKIYDNGNLIVPNQFDSSVQYEFRGWKPGGLGPVNVRDAIAMSSDIFFYQVAGGNQNTGMQGLGADKLAEYYRKFNLGKIVGIDIPGEKPGLVPDPKWKAEFFKADPIMSKWYLGDTYHVGIGQGDLLVTPLQVAMWTAVIANNGVGFQPAIANKAIDSSGKTVWQNQPEVMISNIASLDAIKIAQQGMRQTVLSGTAKPLLSLPITSAGKTGTSQFDGSNPLRTHAWFTAYAPYEDPQVVITVLVEAGGEGNAVAEPVVKNALLWWANNRYHP